MTLREALAKLSAEDRKRYEVDFWTFGNAMIHERDDGSVVYVPPKDWPPHLIKSVRKP